MPCCRAISANFLPLSNMHFSRRICRNWSCRKYTTALDAVPRDPKRRIWLTSRSFSRSSIGEVMRLIPHLAQPKSMLESPNCITVVLVISYKLDGSNVRPRLRRGVIWAGLVSLPVEVSNHQILLMLYLLSPNSESQSLSNIETSNPTTELTS
jgi:hypothetical protein